MNIKHVEKSLLELFTDDVLQLVDRSHGKDSGNPRRQHALEAIEEVPEDDDDTYLDEDVSENDDPYTDEDGHFLANEQVVSDIDDDLAHDDEENHEALLGYREARDLTKEARVARGFYTVVVPIRSHKPTGRGKGDSSSVKNVSGKTGRGKGGRESKGSGRPSDSRGRGRKEKGRGRSGARDGSSSSQVCFKCGSNDHWARDCPKMDDGSSNLKKRNLGAYAYGAWTCSNPDNSRDEKCSSDWFQVDPLCGTAVSPVQDDDECEAHAAFLVEAEGFGVLDCGATSSFGSVEGADDTHIPEVDPYGGRSLNFGDVASSKATSLSRLPVRNDALCDFWIRVHLFVDQPKPTPLMLGMDFLKEQRCVIDYGKDLIQCPMQSDCWCPLFVSSRGLYSCHCAVNIGSLHHENNDKLPHRERLSGWSCVCVLEVCAARDSPLTNTVRQRLHDISSAERWTFRDHDLSKTSGRRSALTNLELVRPYHAVFFPSCCGFNVPISNGRQSDGEKYIDYSCSLLVQKQLSFGDAHVAVECASDSLIPKFLRVTLDTFWGARIDLCMHGLVHPQTHLQIFRSVFVYTSLRMVFEALDRRCDGHRGLPHAVLTSESVRHVSFLPSETAGVSFRENHGQDPNSTLCQRKSETM